MLSIGIDIGGTNIKMGLIGESSEGKTEILSKLSFPFEHCKYGKLCAQISEASSALCQSYGCSREEIGAVGVAVPGCVDKSGDVLVHAYNVGYHNVPVRTELAKYFEGVPVVMDNDANAAALAEMYGGVFRGRKTALLLTLGTGLGAGLIIDGKLFNGGQNHGCEVGHLPFKSGEDHCTCGLDGCMEAYTTSNRLVRLGQERIDKNINNAKQVIELAKQNNKQALDIISEYTDNLASIIGGLCSFIDPEIVALGGGLSYAGDMLFEPLNRLVAERNFFREKYTIVQAEMGNDAGILGAGVLYKHKLNLREK